VEIYKFKDKFLTQGCFQNQEICTQTPQFEFLNFTEHIFVNQNDCMRIRKSFFFNSKSFLKQAHKSGFYQKVLVETILEFVTAIDCYAILVSFL